MLRFFLLVASTAIADLGSKAWALHALQAGPKTAIEGRLSFVLARNPSGAMGFLHQLGPEPRRAMLIALATLGSIAMTRWALRSRPEERLLRVGLGLVLGGALGNLVDRVMRGAVVDFIDVIYAPGRHWHTFNVADVAIVVGVGLLMWVAAPARKVEGPRPMPFDLRP